MKRTCLAARRRIRPAAAAIRVIGLGTLILLSAFAVSAQQPAIAEGWVVLPVDDYRALRQAAFPSEREPEPPPVEATLSRVDYDLKRARVTYCSRTPGARC